MYVSTYSIHMTVFSYVKSLSQISSLVNDIVLEMNVCFQALVVCVCVCVCV